MRIAMLLLLLLPGLLAAQDAKRFKRAVEHRTPHALDRWMKHELRAARKGTRITQPGSSYVEHSSTYDALTSWLRGQRSIDEADWDRCIFKPMTWPGRSTIGLRVRMDGGIRERCYDVQEGRMGTINLFGWRPHVRKSREVLKFLGARECRGFVEAQRNACKQVGY